MAAKDNHRENRNAIGDQAVKFHLAPVMHERLAAVARADRRKIQDLCRLLIEDGLPAWEKKLGIKTALL